MRTLNYLNICILLWIIVSIYFLIYFTLIVPVTVGRKTDDPKPDIIFGGVSIHKNHARFNLLDNGLI